MGGEAQLGARGEANGDVSARALQRVHAAQLLDDLGFGVEPLADAGGDDANVRTPTAWRMAG